MPVRPGDRRGLDGAQAARGRGGGGDNGGAEVDGADLIPAPPPKACTEAATRVASTIPVTAAATARNSSSLLADGRVKACASRWPATVKKITSRIR
jgi:hypothetical protein